MKTHILIVSEGSPGHLSQSEGLVRMLPDRLNIETSRVETRHRFGGLIRKLITTWMGSSGCRLPDAFLCRFLDCDPRGLTHPDLILTSGGKAVFAARSLAVALDAPLVFIGERKPYPSTWFDLLLTPSPLETGPNDTAIETIPTSIHPALVAEAAAAWTDKPDGPLWCMMVGGSSKSHHYNDQDWQDLGNAMTTLARKHGIRWLLSTSHRTGRQAEQTLKAALAPTVLADAVWWAEQPRKCMAAFLGASERTFVTQDSVTMVTECIHSGKPTTAVHPTDVQLPTDSFLSAYYQRLAGQRRIARIRIDELQTHANGPPALETITADDLLHPARIVTERFLPDHT